MKRQGAVSAVTFYGLRYWMLLATLNWRVMVQLSPGMFLWSSAPILPSTCAYRCLKTVFCIVCTDIQPQVEWIAWLRSRAMVPRLVLVALLNGLREITMLRQLLRLQVVWVVLQSLLFSCRTAHIILSPWFWNTQAVLCLSKRKFLMLPIPCTLTEKNIPWLQSR